MDTPTRILIADDEASCADSTAELLRKNGYECTTVPDGATAMQLLGQAKFDLLIADICMAGNLDLELVKQLADSGAGVPVILVTGYPSVDTAIKALELPVVAYLVKPLEFQQLLTEVRSGVELFRLYRTIKGAQRRAEEDCQALRNIAEALQTMPRSMTSAPLTAFLTLTLQGIVNGLFDWERLSESLQTAKEPQAAARMVEGPLLKRQRDLLEEAIETLEKTKGAFHSKELGELRKKLEKFLKTI